MYLFSVKLRTRNRQSCTAWHIPDNIDDWLDQFEMFSIYEVLPEILELWGTNLITDIESKKNLNAVAAK
jgi:hypothetical protein